LGLKRGSELASVKQAYRKNLYKCHPDRFQNRPDMLPVAERKAKRLIQIYGILERWYESNGGIDPVSPLGAADDAQAREEAGTGFSNDESVRAPFIRPWMRYPAVGLALLALYSAWITHTAETGQAGPLTRVPAATGTVAGPSVPGGAVRTAPDEAGLRAAVAFRQAELAAVAAGRDRDKAEWIRHYVRSLEAERIAALAEAAEAQAQYQRDVTGAAKAIAEAEKEAARILRLEQLDSEAARERFRKGVDDSEEALKGDYNRWLLARGNEAVALIRQIRKVDNTAFGVYANTEDPGRIFEFWTAAEAGAPEINIAGKTGVTVLQPEDRIFPHFRSNIFLHYAEGKQLTAMMETIIERHDALSDALEEKRLQGEDELAHWNERHPLAPVPLPQAMAQVLERRDAAAVRRAKALARLRDAESALDPPMADSAFSQSGAGRQWDARYGIAVSNLNSAVRALAAAPADARH
jgi:hypothetical protein